MDPPHEKLDAHLRLRLSSRDLDRIKLLARQRHLAPGPFVRQLLLYAIDREVLGGSEPSDPKGS